MHDLALHIGDEVTIAGRALLTCVLLALCWSPARAGAADRWIELRSPHFVVASNASEDRARQISHQFERIRTLLQHTIAAGSVELRQPVLVLAVDDERSLREMLPQFWERSGQRPAAAYWHGPYRHYIVLRVDASAHEQERRVLHEYVHLLTHANIPDLPVWLDEGLSELWGAAVVADDAVEVGWPMPNHLKVLREQRWIPLDELLTATRIPDAHDKQRLALFYAESWALADYLTLGGHVLRMPVGAELASPSKLAPPSDVHVRTMTQTESLTFRARFLLDGERPAAALPLLNEALRTSPHDSSALEMLGYYHFQKNDPIEAAGWFDQAIASGSASHLAYFYRSILAGSGEKGTKTEDGYLRKAIELDPAFAPAYARLAGIYVQQDRLSDALPLALKATELEPDNRAYRVDLESLRERMRQPANT